MKDENLINNEEKEENSESDEKEKTSNTKKNDNENEDKMKENDENDDILNIDQEEIKIERIKDNNKYDRSIKVILIGAPKVGKTSIISRLIYEKFNEKYEPSQSLEYQNYSLKIANFTLRMQIWDTASQEKSNSIISDYYRSAEVAVFVYAINDSKSFKDLEKWYNILMSMKKKGDNNSQQDYSLYDNINIKKVLIGNKSDLENERQIDYKEAEKFSKSKAFDIFEEISCKDDDNEGQKVHEIFDSIGKIFFHETKDDGLSSGSFHYIASESMLQDQGIRPEENEKKDNSCCCYIF